ncbi:MAG: Hsp20/alpha crystallin family protein [Actinomycetia bacterium]|nr:Hsp20/alpha crystallin family protein [Actinomycetes bacterium]
MARSFDPIREIFGEASRTISMPMDLVRDGHEFIASIDLPGVDPASIDIDAEERTLTVRAVRTAPTTEGRQWLVRERPTGAFARQLSLGSGLALDKVEAAYADGVLTLRIPVAEAARPRKITVTHNGTPIEASITGEVADTDQPQG